MIRDPSDGSVRENLGSTTVDKTANKIAAANQKPNDTSNLLRSTTSGLQTGSSKPENLARLEKAREWMKNYRKDRK
jgi:hypothetical protein